MGNIIFEAFCQVWRISCKSVVWVDKSKAFGKRGHKGIDNGSTSQSGEVASEAVPAEQ